MKSDATWRDVVRPAEAIRANAIRILRDVCGVRNGESVLVVTDSGRPPTVAFALYEAALECGGSPALVVMEPPKHAGGAELPETVNAALLSADLILGPTSKTIFYAKSVQAACRESGRARFVALSECDEETLTAGGIEADFYKLQPVLDGVLERFNKGRTIHFSTGAGTELSASIEGRDGRKSSGLCLRPGDMTGLPTVEVFIAPNEASVNGTIVADASASGGIGILHEPIRITIEDGRARNIQGGREAAQLERLLADSAAPESYQVAELAVGLNPQCRITGKIIEDEGKYGTCHMALGTNVAFGGTNSAPLHIDLVQWRPTVAIDDEILMEEGHLRSAQLRELME